ncbi:MAG: hypothetical protein OXH82_01085 [Candidatus Dadabacteria bacterium]|nr:hypothetical protein [Candidatus Dadabacteria bacterium]MDE0662512.1 hypothetical protein [Candidatus Dadabacteria bacterium]
MTKMFKKQLSSIIAEYEGALSRSRFDDASDVISPTQIAALQARCMAAIERIAGRGSVYFKQVVEISKKGSYTTYDHTAEQIGVAKALLLDIENDYLKSHEEIIRSDLFADYLEMAAHLEERGYKDSAAVLVGSTLEAHLRKLCNKHKVTSVSEVGKPKKADITTVPTFSFKCYVTN